MLKCKIFFYHVKNYSYLCIRKKKGKDMNNVIGFTNKYYTLWNVSKEDICRTDFSGSSVKIGEAEKFSYVKNISFDLDKVKELYPNVPIDMKLRGTKEFVRNIYKEKVLTENEQKVLENPELIHFFDKNFGEPIVEQNAYYLYCKFDDFDDEQKRYAIEVINSDNGYNNRIIVDGDKYIKTTKEWYEETLSHINEKKRND